MEHNVLEIVFNGSHVNYALAFPILISKGRWDVLKAFLAEYKKVRSSRGRIKYFSRKLPSGNKTTHGVTALYILRWQLPLVRPDSSEL